MKIAYFLFIATLFQPAVAMAQATMYQCKMNRICYDTLPCAGVENPDVEYCRDRLTCDILEDVNFRVGILGNDAALHMPFSRPVPYAVLSKYKDEYKSIDVTYTTLAHVPPKSHPIVRNFIYLETREAEAGLEVDVATVAVDIGPDRATTTTYGRCVLFQ